jgi:hypothetical protein
VAETTGFVCGVDGAAISDPLGRRWRLTSVSWRILSAFERVILHLTKGAGSLVADPTVSVSSFPASRVAREAPGLEPLRSGRTAVEVAFSPAVSDSTGLRHIVPAGMDTVTEISTYRLPDGAAALLGSTGSDCVRLRAPAWQSSDPDDVATAEVYIDVR